MLLLLLLSRWTHSSLALELSSDIHSLLVLQLGVLILITVATISTELWSKVSWFVQFRRVFAVGFFMSIIWNWVYLYKVSRIFALIHTHAINDINIDFFFTDSIRRAPEKNGFIGWHQ